VIGVRREQALERFRTMMPVKFDTADEDPWLNAVLIEAGDDGLATSIEQLLIEAPGPH
jgi:calcineurin-like phosphoesterase